MPSLMIVSVPKTWLCACVSVNASESKAITCQSVSVELLLQCTQSSSSSRQIFFFHRIFSPLLFYIHRFQLKPFGFLFCYNSLIAYSVNHWRYEKTKQQRWKMKFHWNDSTRTASRNRNLIRSLCVMSCCVNANIDEIRQNNSTTQNEREETKNRTNEEWAKERTRNEEKQK